jgi:hypothetical protein
VSDGACRARAAPYGPTSGSSEEDLIRSIVAALNERYGLQDNLIPLAHQAVERYRNAAVSNYLPILIQRYAFELASRQYPPTASLR